MRILLAVTLLGLLIPTPSITAKDDPMHELLMTKSHYRCNDYSLNAVTLIPRYYDENKIDSIAGVLNYWENECGLNDYLFCAKLLIAIKMGVFSEDTYDRDIVDHMVRHRQRLDYSYGKGMLPLNSSDSTEDCHAEITYDRFIFDLAGDIAASTKPGTLENLIALFYTREYNVFFHELKSPLFADTRLRSYYLERLEELSGDRGERNGWTAQVGGWYPTGDLRTLGSHPQIGASLIGKHGRSEFGLTFNWRFLDSPNMYHVRTDGVFDSTDSFSNGYLGFEVGYELASFGAFQFNAAYGLGFEFLHTIENPKEDERYSINSPNLNLGLEGRVYLDKYHTWFMGLRVRYNIFNFNTKAGTDLSGNAATISLIVGYLKFGEANKALKALNFFD